MAQQGNNKKRSAKARKPRASAKPRDVAGLRILIAEDSFPIGFALELALDAEGATTIGPATTLAQAMQLAGSQDVDLAVVDLRLGDEDSLPLLRQLTEAAVDIILATGSEHTSELTAQFPKLTILRKPFSPQTLIDLIRSPK